MVLAQEPTSRVEGPVEADAHGQWRTAAAWSRAAMTETARMTALKTINADRLLIRCVAAVNRTGA